MENTNEEPPFKGSTLEKMLEDEMAKSLERPVVEPALSATVMVHTIATPDRAGLVLLHERVDAADGIPWTTYGLTSL